MKKVFKINWTFKIVTDWKTTKKKRNKKTEIKHKDRKAEQSNKHKQKKQKALNDAKIYEWENEQLSAFLRSSCENFPPFIEQFIEEEIPANRKWKPNQQKKKMLHPKLNQTKAEAVKILKFEIMISPLLKTATPEAARVGRLRKRGMQSELVLATNEEVVLAGGKTPEKFRLFLCPSSFWNTVVWPVEWKIAVFKLGGTVSKSNIVGGERWWKLFESPIHWRRFHLFFECRNHVKQVHATKHNTLTAA